MSTEVKRRNGGYFTIANRWIDAGYMAAAPGSVTQVYLHLSRWADNGTLQSSQPMKLIAKKCGLSEDVARKAVRTLEAWGVLDRDPDSGRNAKNVWMLNDLPEQAPEYPDKVPPKQSGGPDKVGAQQNGGAYQPNQHQPNVSYQPDIGIGEPEKITTPVPELPSPTPINRVGDDSPRDQLIREHCRLIGVPRPVDIRVARQNADKLVAAGITAADLPAMIAWFRAQPWIHDVDLSTLVRFADRWTSSGDRPITRDETQEELIANHPRFPEWTYLGLYEDSTAGCNQWMADIRGGTLPQFRRKS